MDHIWALYLLTRLDGIHALCFAAAAFGTVGGLILLMAGLIHEEPLPVKWGRRVLIVAAFGIVGAVLVPTSKDAMFILAGVGVIEAAKSDTAKRLTGKSVQVIEDFIDEQLAKKKRRD